jgi:hypothetical protein
LIERGAELPAPGISAFARIVAQKSRPFYVEWISQQQERITAEIYQIDGKFDLLVFISEQVAKEPKAMVQAYPN